MAHRTTAGIVIALLVLGVSAAWSADIVVEGESYSSIKPSMAKTADSTASKGYCVEIPLRRPHATTETGPGDDGHAVYKIRVGVAGTYQLWVRAYWHDACGNSFFVLVDSTSVNTKTPYVTDQTFRKWHWVAGPTIRLSEGVHTIRFQNREDGAKLDQWMLTTKPKNRWVPVRVQDETREAIVK